MRRRVIRLLNVLLIAPVAVSMTAATGLLPHVHAEDSPPAPYVVCIDPGHGGSPNNADPGQLFDSGAVSASGLMEKDLTLDVSLRMRTLLEADGVDVVMTRQSDVYMSIDDREAVCTNAKANLFVSVHLNSFTDPTVSGSLVLYPTAASQAFAQSMSTTLAAKLAPEHIASDGIQLRDDWWTHAPMPTVTVEPAYLSNPHEAALLGTTTFREQLASAVVAGLAASDPALLAHKQALAAWESAHPQATPPPAPALVAQSAPTGSASGGPSFSWVVVAVLLLLAFRLRRGVLALLQVGPLPSRRRTMRERERRRAAVRDRSRARAYEPARGYPSRNRRR